MIHALLLVLGLGVGTLGTLIGAGGGFLLMPILLALYPEEAATTLTAISLSVVTLNAASGSVSYFRKGRVDWRSGLWFALAGFPGAVGGVLLVNRVPRVLFERAFGVLMGILALYLLFKSPRSTETVAHKRGTLRVLKDAHGHTYRYHFSMPLGLTISTGVGLLSSFLGIGGGIIHVPALSHFMGFPVHIATATSHFTLALTGLIGVLGHLHDGTLYAGLERLVWLAPGVVVGAQIGAHLSTRVKGSVILRLLAVALIVVSLRLIAR